MMCRTITALLLLLWACLPSAALAQQPEQTEELKAIRKLVEQQSLEIQELSKEIKALRASLAPTPPSDQLEKSEPAAVSAPAQELPQGNRVHVIAKGDTLTSIAKKYKVNVPDLLKLNKITDERKLQIGQSLVIPQAAESQNQNDKN